MKYGLRAFCGKDAGSAAALVIITNVCHFVVVFGQRPDMELELIKPLHGGILSIFVFFYLTVPPPLPEGVPAGLLAGFPAISEDLAAGFEVLSASSEVPRAS